MKAGIIIYVLQKHVSHSNRICELGNCVRITNNGCIKTKAGFVQFMCLDETEILRESYISLRFLLNCAPDC